MKKTILKNYARLIARVGVNVQKGQEVILTAGLDQPEFVRMLSEECYRAGAKKVRVEWIYDPLTKVDAKWQKEKTLSEVAEWERAKLQHMVDTLPCRIFLESSDPDALSGIPQPKYSNAMQARRKVTKPYRDAIENVHQWCIAAVPGEAWAKKLFPGLRKKQAEEKLWDAILKASRAMDDPIKAWEEHNRDLHERCAFLNSLSLRKLHYTSAKGTDFTVGLMDDGMFAAGAGDTLKGVTYNPNIPSEEVFTSPMRGEAEGIVYATKPLSFMGQLIEDFSIRFENGHAVEVHAGKNEELLRKMISMDEGASFLGECALVPAGSPIDASGILFYNTLFDENAACHLAFGEGFPECVKGFENMSLEECRKKGINESIIHEDFMIGDETLSIDGITKDGKKIPVFRNGTWAF